MQYIFDETKTDAQGRYEYRAALGSQMRIQPVPSTFPFDAEPNKVEAEVVGEVVADFHLKEPDTAVNPPIAGTVLDPDGRPASGVLIFATEYQDNPEPSLARTDAEGRFHVEPYQRPVLIAARSPDVRRLAAAIEVGTGTSEVTLTLAPSATIRGRVVGPDGGPKAGVQIPWSWGLRTKPDDEPTCSISEWVRTASEGRFALENLPVGVRLKVVIDPFGGLFSELPGFPDPATSIRVEAPGPMDLPDFVLDDHSLFVP